MSMGAADELKLEEVETLQAALGGRRLSDVARPRSAGGLVAAKGSVATSAPSLLQQRRPSATTLVSPCSPNSAGGGHFSDWSTASSPKTKRPGSSPGCARPTTPGNLSPGSVSCSNGGSTRRKGLTTEEKNCFRRTLTPSSSCEGKLENYFQTTGTLRNAFTQDGLNQLPVLKGNFYHHPSFKTAASPSSRTLERARSRRRRAETSETKVEYLPQEALTSNILEEIFPRQPSVAEPLTKAADASPTGQNAVTAAAVTFSPNAGAIASDRVGGCASGGDMKRSLKAMTTVPKRSSCGPSPAAKGRAASPDDAADFNVALGISDDNPKQREGQANWRQGVQLHRSDSSPKMAMTLPVSDHGFGALSSTTPASRTPGNAATVSGAIGGVSTLARQVSCTAGLGKTWISPQSPDGIAGGPVNSQSVMIEFRKLLLEKWPSVKVAFETIASEFPENHNLTRKEWKRVLHKHGFFWTNEERDVIFDRLDFSGDGSVSPTEFTIAIEAAAPVRSLEDLRRRWLASGYASMLQPISILDDNGQTTRRRLSLKEFAEAMAHVHVTDFAECAAIFNIVSCDGNRVSIGELASSIATVSPWLPLEDIRERFVKKYGTLEKAFWDLDSTHSNAIQKQDWLHRLHLRCGISEAEGKIAFRLIDIDRSGEVSRYEFLSALGLSEPQLSNEDLRKKVRQRFRSIKQAIITSLESSTEDEPMERVALPLDKFQEIFSQVIVDDKTLSEDAILTDEETMIIFEIVDVSHTGKLTAKSFLRGVHFLAPSTVLEDIRLTCLQRHQNISDAFDGLSVERSQLLDYKGFEKVLKDLKLNTSKQIQAIFDLLDIKVDGTVSCSRLIAALRSGNPGGKPLLPPEERDIRAKQDARVAMADVQKKVCELRTQVRQGLGWCDEVIPAAAEGEDQHAEAANAQAAAGNGSIDVAVIANPTIQGKIREGLSETLVAALGANAIERAKLRTKNWSQERGSSPVRGANSAGSAGIATKDRSSSIGTGGSRGNVEGPAVHQSVSAPRLRTTPHEILAPYVGNLAFRTYDPKKTSQHSFTGTQSSWNNIWTYVKKSPGGATPERGRLEKDLHGYFQLATYSLSHDVPLLQDMHRFSELHFSTRQHIEALRPNKAKLLEKAAKEAGP